MLKALLEGGSHGARELNVDAAQGLREIVQNADDLGASEVRFGIQTVKGQVQLLIVHDGACVELKHVLPMIYPFLSTKLGDARQKGRFGVGLKTLGRLGGGLTVHSKPFHFGADDNLAVRVPAATPVAGFYDPDRQETLFTLNLDDEYGPDLLHRWFDSWSPADLIFLDTVRRLSLHVLDCDEQSWFVEVQEEGPPAAVELKLGKHSVSTERRRIKTGAEVWERFVAQVPVPEGRRRSGKATTSFTPVGVAISVGGVASGRIHVALPTRISTGGAFSVDAQFDPATSREELVENSWNKWLVPITCQVLAAVSIRLAHASSALAWHAVPIDAETTSTAPWLNELFLGGFKNAVALFAGDSRLIGDSPGAQLSNWSYCDPASEDLLSPDEHEAISGKPMLPMYVRDPGGRWLVVLSKLNLSDEITLPRILEGCEGSLFDSKSVAWCLDLAERSLANDLQDSLIGARWIPLANGDRVYAQEAEEATELLTIYETSEPFAIRHGLVKSLHPEFAQPGAEQVRNWILEAGNAVERPEAGDILRTFSKKFRSDPLVADHRDLLQIRDLFAPLADRDAAPLGARVGAALSIEAVRLDVNEGGLSSPTKVRSSPSECYLPPSIDDDPNGWSAAAAGTPGLTWAASVYQEVFKVARQQRREGPATARGRPRAAKRILMLLGAANAPRLKQVRTQISYSLPQVQWPAARAVGRAVGYLENDYVSPDLDKVIADIVNHGARKRRRVSGRRRGTDGNRSVALFRCLVASWAMLGSKSQAWALRQSGRGGYLKQVPATWVARLAESPWVQTEAGTFETPRNLAIATRITSVIYEGAEEFALGLGEADAGAELAVLLEMRVDPSASELVARLEDYREAATPADVGDMLRLYRALAGHCPTSSTRCSADDKVSDTTIAALRGKFGISRSRRGLISGCVTTGGGDRWFAPNAVFSGRDIFHRRQAFVLNDRDLVPLWNALNITAPSITDCVRELAVVAKEKSVPQLDALLIDIYRHIDARLDKASAAERRMLITIPLLTPDGWWTKRPIYRTDYEGLSVSSLKIWSPPCALGTIKRFAQAVDVTELEFDDEPNSVPYGSPDELQARFEVALQLLKASLAKEDERAYHSVPWPRVERLPLNVHSPNALVVSAILHDGGRVPLTVRSHAQMGAAAIHVDGPEVLGRAEYGGFAVARFVEPERRRDIALAWVAAWGSSEDAASTTGIDLALDQNEEDLDQLAAQFDRLKRSGGKRRMPDAKGNTSSAGAAKRRVEHRRLKESSDFFQFTLVHKQSSTGARKGHQQSKKVPLRKDSPGPAGSSGSAGKKPLPASVQRLYDNNDLQREGWKHVQMAFEEGEIRLNDFQQTRGIGADGAVEWKTFVEMKAVGREPPAQVSFTEAEFKRALERKGHFLLVVVSGLEEGFQTQISVYADPLGTLPWVPRGSVSIGGLDAGPALVLYEAAQGEPERSAA